MTQALQVWLSIPYKGLTRKALRAIGKERKKDSFAGLSFSTGKHTWVMF
jgi:hypothetical protein